MQLFTRKCLQTWRSSKTLIRSLFSLEKCSTKYHVYDRSSRENNSRVGRQADDILIMRGRIWIRFTLMILCVHSASNVTEPRAAVYFGLSSLGEGSPISPEK